VIATLATSTDPAHLVPGSLEALGRDADALVAQADALDDDAAQVRRREVPGWLGDASAGWDQRRPQIADSLTVPGQVYRAAADVLRAHAGALVWARAQVEVAIDLWAQGLARSARTEDRCLRPGSVLVADRPWTSPLAQSLRAQARGPFQAGVQGSAFAQPDAGAPARVMAEQLLAAIRQEVGLSARAAAGFLDRCCEGMPDGRWHWDQYYAGLWEWVTGIGALVAKFNVVRFATDTGGYFSDLYAMGAGPVELAGYLAANPHDFNRLVLDSETFRDNPARWWGRLAPDVALTVAGGAGVASKLLSRAGAGTRLVDDLADAAGVADALTPGTAAYTERLLDRAATAEVHLRRPGMETSGANDAMLERIRSAATEGRPLHISEENFLRHEMLEAKLMDTGMGYGEAHAAAGATHPTYANYHPGVLEQYRGMFSRGWYEYWDLEP